MSKSDNAKLLETTQLILEEALKIKGGMINVTRFFHKKRWRKIKEKAGLFFPDQKAEYRFKWHLKRKIPEEAQKRGLKILTEKKRNGHLLTIYILKPDKWIQPDNE